MIFESPSVERLIESFRKLPGVGKRSAERYVLHLLSAPAADAEAMSAALREARARVTTCSVCANLTDGDPCAICRSATRDSALICVVEHPAAVLAIEKGGGYRGLYHVLHGALNPLEGTGPDELTIDRLVKRVKAGGIDEVILATNATAEGEATALYLTRLLTPLNVFVSRIAHGVPMGGGVEYADSATLSHALQGRIRLG